MLGRGRFEVTLGEATHQIERVGAAWQVDDRKVTARIQSHSAGVSVFWGNGYHFTQPDPLDVAGEAGATGVVEAPMPGLVKSVAAKAGARVGEGDVLVVLEAMKMEHALTAARDGIIAEVLVSADDQVEAGAALVRLEDEAEA